MAVIGVETAIIALGDEAAFAKLTQGRSRLTEAHEGERLPKMLGLHMHVSASKRQYPVAIADTTGYFYIFPATRAEKAKLSGSVINLDADDTPSGDGLHVTRRLHISTMFVVR